MFAGNQMRSLNQTKKDDRGAWRPGMEQFVASFKWRSTRDATTLSTPQGILLPEVLRQKTGSELQQSMMKRNLVCHRCSKPERKYVCPRTNRVSCSFECFKTLQASN